MFYAVLLVLLGVILAINLILLLRMKQQDGCEARLRDDIARLQQNQSLESRALREELAGKRAAVRDADGSAAD